MINVFDELGNIIARVTYTENLDFWDGRNNSCGSRGHHRGLTQLENGDYVLIHGTDWQGERDSAEIITAGKAAQEILLSGNDQLFNKFAELKKYKEENLIKENV